MFLKLEELRSAQTERERRLLDFGELQRQLAVEQSHSGERQLLVEQTTRALEAARRSCGAEDLSRQLRQQQEELSECLKNRHELHALVEKATAKFREPTSLASLK